MLATAIIVFREVLEAALVVGIVMAASRGVPRRALWVGGGLAVGIAGACLVAGFAETLAAAAAGMGQELFNAAILLLAVLMLGWHNIWMGRHGRELAQEAHVLGRAVGSGARPLYALAIVVGMAVLREGSELVLFLYGIAASAGGSANMLGGGLLGLAAGSAMGMALYFGLLRIPMRHLFTATSILILLLAAGMAAQAASFLAQADLLPALGQQVWDTSAFVGDDSIAGKALHALIGYVAEPAGIQLVFWAATVLGIGAMMRLAAASEPPKDGAGGIARSSARARPAMSPDAGKGGGVPIRR
ncbi:MAG: FTR1 family protein [Alphaproteobacteria bacterium]|nr:FTR1 family protein [Alphaproteobacteria bacterium]